MGLARCHEVKTLPPLGLRPTRHVPAHPVDGGATSRRRAARGRRRGTTIAAACCRPGCGGRRRGGCRCGRRRAAWPTSALEPVDHLEQVRAGPERQVHRRVVGDAAGDRVDDHLGDRADVGEVAALGAVAVHRQRLAGQRGVHERRDHRGIGMAGCLAGAEHVEEPERQCSQPVAVLIRHGVLLGGELADRVRAEGLGRQAFVFGQRRVGAVHRRRRSDDHVGSSSLRAASRTRSVPVALASWLATGSTIERGTDGIAARCTIASTPAPSTPPHRRAHQGRGSTLRRGACRCRRGWRGCRWTGRRCRRPRAAAASRDHVRSDEAGRTGDEYSHRRGHYCARRSRPEAPPPEASGAGIRASRYSSTWAAITS